MFILIHIFIHTPFRVDYGGREAALVEATQKYLSTPDIFINNHDSNDNDYNSFLATPRLFPKCDFYNMMSKDDIDTNNATTSTGGTNTTNNTTNNNNNNNSNNNNNNNNNNSMISTTTLNDTNNSALQQVILGSSKRPISNRKKPNFSSQFIPTDVIGTSVAQHAHDICNQRNFIVKIPSTTLPISKALMLGPLSPLSITPPYLKMKPTNASIIEDVSLLILYFTIFLHNTIMTIVSYSINFLNIYILF